MLVRSVQTPNYDLVLMVRQRHASDAAARLESTSLLRDSDELPPYRREPACELSKVIIPQLWQAVDE